MDLPNRVKIVRVVRLGSRYNNLELGSPTFENIILAIFPNNPRSCSYKSFEEGILVFGSVFASDPISSKNKG